MNTNQILVQNATEKEIVMLFDKMKISTKLNWLKPYKNMFIVNFDLASNKNFNRYPHDFQRLSFFLENLEYKTKQDLYIKLRKFGKKIELGGSRCLWEIDGKTYQAVMKLTLIGKRLIFKLVDLFETDNYQYDRETQISDDAAMYLDNELHF